MKHLKLQTQFDIQAWYKRIADSGKPVAWVSAFAPAELLLALGIEPVYPENHAAAMGALSAERNQDNPYANDAIQAFAALNDTKGLCNYARADLGVLMAAAQTPFKGFPQADLFYSCTSQCQVVARWGHLVQEHYQSLGKSVPHYVLSAPKVKSEQASEEQVEQLHEQVADHIQKLCFTFNLSYDESRLIEIIEESNAANKLWQECLMLAQHSPSPWSMNEAFTAMAPIVIARGHRICTDYYRSLKSELEQRLADGASQLPNESIRLLWDGIPIWPYRRHIAERCAQHGAHIVCSTYTHSWWFNFNIQNPLDALVRRYAVNTMNLPIDVVLQWTLDICSDFKVDGILAHHSESCGIWNSYVKRRLTGYAAAGLPTALLKGDIVRASAVNLDDIDSAIDNMIHDIVSKRNA